MQNSIQPIPMPLAWLKSLRVFRRHDWAQQYLLGSSSVIPGYDTKTTPAPKPIRVDPQATLRVAFAVAPTIFESNLD